MHLMVARDVPARVFTLIKCAGDVAFHLMVPLLGTLLVKNGPLSVQMWERKIPELDTACQKKCVTSIYSKYGKRTIRRRLPQ